MPIKRILFAVILALIPGLVSADTYVFGGNTTNSVVYPLSFGSGSNYSTISSTGGFTFYGTAERWDDLRIEVSSLGKGATAPTDTTGFRGNANFNTRNFVHTQADEVQFEVQLPHTWDEGTTIYPHFHFSPITTGTGAVKFVLSCYIANPVTGIFPASPSDLDLTKTVSVASQWGHLIAANSTGYDMTGYLISTILKCRLYRDNTVGSNLAAAVSGLYVDIHFKVNTLGSTEEYTK